jgi:hypothetical protein
MEKRILSFWFSTSNMVLFIVMQLQMAVGTFFIENEYRYCPFSLIFEHKRIPLYKKEKNGQLYCCICLYFILIEQQLLSRYISLKA